MRGTRTLSILLLIVVVAGCGNYSRIGRYADDTLDVPSEVALKSTVLGMTRFRMSRDISTICVGRVPRPEIRETDREAVRARRAWEARLAGIIGGAAPTVVPAVECVRDDEGFYRLRATRTEAIQLALQIAPVENGWTTATVNVAIGGGRRGGGMWFRLVQDDEGWWVHETRCQGGIFCDDFDFAQVMEGLPTSPGFRGSR